MANSFKQKIANAVQGSVKLTCAVYAADNLLASLNLTAADPAPQEHLAGERLQEDLRYAERVAKLYLSTAPDLRGRVAEIGPGGSAAVALHLLDHGCASVDLVDRFAFSHDSATVARVYDHIIRSKPILLRRFGDRRDLEPEITSFVGEGAAAERFFLRHRGYDAIVSNAVLEHLYDPLLALSAMTTALNPGGKLLHQVDLRDHGMFTGGGHHELTFLTVPAWFYPWMSRRRGRPNRVLVNRYRERLDSLKLDYQILVTHLVGVGEVEPQPYEKLPSNLRRNALESVREQRGALAPEFQQVRDEDLSVASFFIHANK